MDLDRNMDQGNRDKLFKTVFEFLNEKFFFKAHEVVELYFFAKLYQLIMVY